MQRNGSYGRSPAKRFEYKFKIIVIGDSGTGKSSLISTFLHGRSGFSRTYITTKVKEVHTKYIRINNSLILLEIWDLSGADDFRTMTTYHYSDSDGLMVVYSLTNEESWCNVTNWLRNVESYLGPEIFARMRKMLVATKGDSPQRVISDSRGEQRAGSMALTNHIETSARDCSNVQLAFHQLAKDLYDVAVNGVKRNSDWAKDSDMKVKAEKRKELMYSREQQVEGNTRVSSYVTTKNSSTDDELANPLHHSLTQTSPSFISASEEDTFIPESIGRETRLLKPHRSYLHSLQNSQCCASCKRIGFNLR